jgi:hypothetical protein
MSAGARDAHGYPQHINLPHPPTVETEKDSGFYALLSLIMALPLAAWKGWILVKLWVWFLVPLGVPGINIWHAAGIASMLSWLADSSGIYSAATRKTDTYSPQIRFWLMLTLGIVMPLIVWAYGAIYHSFMY